MFFCCCKSCWPSEFRMEARVVKERRGRNSVYMLVRYHESGCVNAFDPVNFARCSQKFPKIGQEVCWRILTFINRSQIRYSQCLYKTS